MMPLTEEVFHVLMSKNSREYGGSIFGHVRQGSKVNLFIDIFLHTIVVIHCLSIFS